MALADLVKDLKTKTEDAKKRVEGGLKVLGDAGKVEAAKLTQKKKMDDFVNGIIAAVGRAKEARDKILQNKDYKAITSAADKTKAEFTKLSETINKTIQPALGKLRETARTVEGHASREEQAEKIRAAAAAAEVAKKRKLLEAEKARLRSFDTAEKAFADKAVWKALEVHAKSEYSDENFRFIAAIDSGKLTDALKMVNAGDINLPADLAAAIKAKPKDAAPYRTARGAIMRLIGFDTLKRWRDPQISKIDEALKKLPK